MFINRLAPVKAYTGDILSPENINENNNYFKKALQFVADKQTCRWTTTYSLVLRVDQTVTNATANLDMLLRRAIPPPTFRVVGATGGTGGSSKTAAVVIESVSIVIYYTATTAFELAVRPNGTASDERIEFPVRSSSLATEPYQVVRLMNLTHNDTRDLFRVRTVGGTTGSLPAGTTITKFDVTVGFASDKYISGNRTNSTLTKPNITLPEFTDASLCQASTFTGIKSTVEAAATDAQAGVPFRWSAVDFFDITSATAIVERAKPAIGAYVDPLFNGSIQTAPNIIGIWVDADLSVVGTGSVSTNLLDSSFVSIGYNLSNPVAANIQAGTIGTQTRNTGTPSNTTDYYATLTAPAGNTIRRATIYVLFQ